MSNPLISGSSPAQHGTVTINSMPAANLIRRLKACREPYYAVHPVAEHLPYIAHNHDIAILAPDKIDRTRTVEGLQPVITALNGIDVHDILLYQNLQVAGVITSDTADDLAADVKPAPSALQIGGVCTVRNTGNVPIKMGDTVAIRLPVPGTVDMWHVENPPPKKETDRGIVRPITYPLEQEAVSIIDAAQKAELAGAPTQQLIEFGQAAVDSMLASREENAAGRLTLTGITAAFAAGLVMAPLLAEMQGYDAPNNAADVSRSTMRFLGMPIIAAGAEQMAPQAPRLFDTEAHAIVARRTVLDVAKYLLLPGATLEAEERRRIPGILELDRLKPITDSMLYMIASAVAAYGKNIRGSILGQAKSNAAKGEFFDIQVGQSYML
jgi:hypothetical protein